MWTHAIRAATPDDLEALTKIPAIEMPSNRRTKGYEVTFMRRIPHPPERVWAMLTDFAAV